MKEGWDSYHGSPITTAALRTADALAFVPTADGGLQLDLHAGGLELEISIAPGGRIHDVNVALAGAYLQAAP